MCVDAGPGSQPSSVVVSGVSIDQTITFEAGETQAIVSFSLTNDNVGLESDELYQLRLTNPSPSSIITGGAANIIITDDEGSSIFWRSPGNPLHQTRYFLPCVEVTVSFQQSSYSFSENAGTGFVRIILSNPVAIDFQLRVVGGE